MDRVLFESVRQKSLAQWSHRTVVRNNSDHLLTGRPFLSDANALLNIGRRSPRADIASAGWKCL